ncbi:hypothetical protein PspLS_11928 [Pyricularia sp. CBS 133598]|nr:hypothetical protein PspLS_11928 [Pyricularia sp. CBS 133598]
MSAPDKGKGSARPVADKQPGRPLTRSGSATGSAGGEEHDSVLASMNKKMPKEEYEKLFNANGEHAGYDRTRGKTDLLYRLETDQRQMRDDVHRQQEALRRLGDNVHRQEEKVLQRWNSVEKSMENLINEVTKQISVLLTSQGKQTQIRLLCHRERHNRLVKEDRRHRLGLARR